MDLNESASHVEPFPFNVGLVYMTCSEVMASSRVIQAELDKSLHTGACLSEMLPLGAHLT